MTETRAQPRDDTLRLLLAPDALAVNRAETGRAGRALALALPVSLCVALVVLDAPSVTADRPVLLFALATIGLTAVVVGLSAIGRLVVLRRRRADLLRLLAQYGRDPG